MNLVNVFLVFLLILRINAITFTGQKGRLVLLNLQSFCRYSNTTNKSEWAIPYVTGARDDHCAAIFANYSQCSTLIRALSEVQKGDIFVGPTTGGEEFETGSQVVVLGGAAGLEAMIFAQDSFVRPESTSRWVTSSYCVNASGSQGSVSSCASVTIDLGLSRYVSGYPFDTFNITLESTCPSLAALPLDRPIGVDINIDNSPPVALSTSSSFGLMSASMEDSNSTGKYIKTMFSANVQRNTNSLAVFDDDFHPFRNPNEVHTVQPLILQAFNALLMPYNQSTLSTHLVQQNISFYQIHEDTLSAQDTVFIAVEERAGACQTENADSTPSWSGIPLVPNGLQCQQDAREIVVNITFVTYLDCDSGRAISSSHIDGFGSCRSYIKALESIVGRGELTHISEFVLRGHMGQWTTNHTQPLAVTDGNGSRVYNLFSGIHILFTAWDSEGASARHGVHSIHLSTPTPVVTYESSDTLEDVALNEAGFIDSFSFTVPTSQKHFVLKPVVSIGENGKGCFVDALTRNPVVSGLSFSPSDLYSRLQWMPVALEHPLCAPFAASIASPFDLCGGKYHNRLEISAGDKKWMVPTSHGSSRPSADLTTKVYIQSQMHQPNPLVIASAGDIYCAVNFSTGDAITASIVASSGFLSNSSLCGSRVMTSDRNRIHCGEHISLHNEGNLFLFLMPLTNLSSGIPDSGLVSQLTLRIRQINASVMLRVRILPISSAEGSTSVQALHDPDVGDDAVHVDSPATVEADSSSIVLWSDHLPEAVRRGMFALRRRAPAPNPREAQILFADPQKQFTIPIDHIVYANTTISASASSGVTVHRNFSFSIVDSATLAAVDAWVSDGALSLSSRGTALSSVPVGVKVTLAVPFIHIRQIAPSPDVVAYSESYARIRKLSRNPAQYQVEKVFLTLSIMLRAAVHEDTTVATRYVVSRSYHGADNAIDDVGSMISPDVALFWSIQIDRQEEAIPAHDRPSSFQLFVAVVMIFLVCFSLLFTAVRICYFTHLKQAGYRAPRLEPPEYEEGAAEPRYANSMENSCEDVELADVSMEKVPMNL